MYFEGRELITTVLELEDLEQDPDIIYRHFMQYGDEVFYILKNGKMYGIVTPGNLYRTYCAGRKIPQPNTNFSYIRHKQDKEQAREILEKFPTIHEVAVVEDGCFSGVLKSGYRKSAKEWRAIRESLQSPVPEAFSAENILRRDIRKLLELDCQFYIYRCLRAEDMGLSAEERIIFQQKRDLLADEDGLYALTERERTILLGENNSTEFIDVSLDFGRKRQIIYRNGIPEYKDYHSAFLNIDRGYRVVPNAPAGAPRKIFMVGPCTMFGTLGDDGQTIEAYLQGLLLEAGYSTYEVINCSVTGNLSLPRLFREQISEQDIVIIMTWDYSVWEKFFETEHPGNLRCLESMAEIWNEIDQPVAHVFNLPEHCSTVVEQKIAERMFQDIYRILRMDEAKAVRGKQLQPYYISFDIVCYYAQRYKEYINLAEVSAGGGVLSSERGRKAVGAIVANCNPFTKGHRYLAEWAAARVDCLYVFVVEEDRSEFSFQDRFEMVKCGLADLGNVYVLPSGEYVISSKTFEQYFIKDNVSQIADMDYDLHIFGEVVAPLLGIRFRFVGEEPFDRVTAKYNETMKRILPQHGVKVIEIPRLTKEGGEIISASKVREYIHAGKREELTALLPDSTLEYLQAGGMSHDSGEKDH